MKFRVSVFLTVVLALAMSACGGGSDNNGNGSSTSVASKGGLLFTLPALYHGTNQSPPTSGPKPEPGKKVWILSCGQAFTSCAAATGAAEEAAHTLGWQTTIFDTKGDLPTAGTGVRQAIAAGADAIYFWYIDCQNMQQPLSEARKAGIEVVAAESFDCNYGNSGQPPLFSYQVHYVGGDWEHFVQIWTRAVADYAIAKTDNNATAMYLIDDTALVNPISVKAFEDEMSKCGDCKSVIEQFPISELGGGLQARVQQALIKNPDVNAVAVAYDAILLGGAEAGIQSSGRNLLVINSTGDSAMDLVREGKADGGIGYSAGWEAYSGMDALNRLFNGDTPMSSGMGLQAYDQNHNLPASGPYEPPIDYKAIYRKAWGAG